MDLSGTECNKVGVYYTGFRRQLGKCAQRQQSYVCYSVQYSAGQLDSYEATVYLSSITDIYFRCFTNQPLDFWEHDDVSLECRFMHSGN